MNCSCVSKTLLAGGILHPFPATFLTFYIGGHAATVFRLGSRTEPPACRAAPARRSARN